MSEYSAEELLRLSKFIKDMQSVLGGSRDDNDDDEARAWDDYEKASSALAAYAKRIKADENATPVADQLKLGTHMNLISINEAAKRGIERLRKPKWIQPEDHLKIDILDEHPGPWGHLYAPFNRECNGRDPVDILMLEGTNVAEWLPYTGPLPDSDEYKAVQAKFDGCIRWRDEVHD